MALLSVTLLTASLLSPDPPDAAELVEFEEVESLLPIRKGQEGQQKSFSVSLSLHRARLPQGSETKARRRRKAVNTREKIDGI